MFLLGDNDIVESSTKERSFPMQANTTVSSDITASFGTKAIKRLERMAEELDRQAQETLDKYPLL
jgi:hypothetical protein